MSDNRETDFAPDWKRYPSLGLLFRHRPEENVYWRDLRQLLRDARADAVRFVADVKSEELKKAFDRGVQRGMDAILRDNE